MIISVGGILKLLGRPLGTPRPAFQAPCLLCTGIACQLLLWPIEEASPSPSAWLALRQVAFSTLSKDHIVPRDSEMSCGGGNTTLYSDSYPLSTFPLKKTNI